ncbi:MAG: ATP phosphoribosyltransferase regulatory subunit [Spirochaetia bacterium]|nr:ATP phosphoribosyltransferase regulatory subunit [Spirochaetia bacterium]
MLTGNDKYRSWIPHGFNFLSVKETESLTTLSDTVRKSLKKNQYMEVIPPSLDFYRTFQITARQSSDPVFEVRDASGEVLAVRSDLTVQVVKAAAAGRLGKDRPLNVFYIQPVFHDRTWGAGNRREMVQAGIESIGNQDPDRFLKILSLASELIHNNRLEAKFLYGDVRFLNALFETIPENLRSPLSEAFHLKDTYKIRSMIKGVCSSELTDLLTEVPLIFGDHRALDELEFLCKKNENLLSCIREARKVPNVIYDFSLVRELTYYTGPVFEGYIENCRETVITGGVYDSLYEQFSGESQTACGFALNLSIISEQI